MNKKPEGIGGWLVLPLLGLVVSSIVFLFFSFSSLFFITEGEIDLYFFMLYASMTFFLIYTTILFFQKKKELPKWIIFTLWYEVFFVIIVSYLIEDYSGVIGGIVGSAIWTLYFLNSKRVQNTFTK